MAYIIPPRRGKSSQRMKRKAFLKEGEDSCMKMSSVATQWTALSSAAVKSSKRHVASQSNSELQTFLDTFPNEIQENEKFLLKMIDEAWQRKDVDAMFQLIKENHFTDMAQKKVLYFWDVGHYYQESEKRSKPLTPLARFRIRERFLPPENICPNGRKKATLPKEATNVLRGWLDNNSPRPYPTRETKAALADLTGLTVMQVNTWFANTRRRMRGKRRTPLSEEEKSKQPYAWNRPSSPQPWQVPIFSTTMTSTPSAFPPCPGVCACPTQFPQFLAPTSLGSTLPGLWSEINANTRTFMEWPGSHAAAVGNQYLPSPMVALAPTLWEPELQYYGLHAAAQILMDMASK